MRLAAALRRISSAATTSPIIGIAFISAGSGGAGVWQRVDLLGNAVSPSAGYFASHPIYSAIIGETIDSQAMIKIPAFFVKGDTLTSGPYTGKRVWWISDTASPGFVRHPAFWSGGSPIAQIWVGKYQAVADGSKLGSLPGLYPIADLDFATMRSRASARNTGSVTGFTIWSYHQISAIQLLLIVELGTPDAQNVLGQGNSTADFGPLQVNNATVAQATWRGIVGLWANVWQMADGLSSSSSMGCMIWDNSGNSSYVGTSLTLPVSGYPTAFSAATGTGYDLRTSFVPSSTSATQTDGATGDRYSAGASAVLYFGGSYGGGAQCGPFYLNLSTDASYSAGNVSSRIAKT